MDTDTDIDTAAADCTTEVDTFTDIDTAALPYHQSAGDVYV